METGDNPFILSKEGLGVTLQIITATYYVIYMIQCVMSFVEGAIYMKRFAAITVTAMVINLFSPLIPQAYAAGLDDQLVAAIAQNSGFTQVQELLTIKQELEQADRSVILGSLTKVALERIPADNIVNMLASGGFNDVAQGFLQQQVDKNITNKLDAYQKELSVLSLLLGGNNSLTSQLTGDTNVTADAPQNYSKVLNMTATAYAPGIPDNGKWDKLTYMGGTVRKGVVAVDPEVIPMGSKVWVEGYGEAVAEDQGSAIKGNRIDLAFNDRQEALDYGIQDIKVYILE